MEADVLPPPVAEWFARRTFPGKADPNEVVSDKRAAGTTVSVCLPALDEEATIGSICSSITGELMRGCGLVDELIVLDSGSSDDTAGEARRGGARVIAAADVLRGEVPDVRVGKGEVLWKSLAVAEGDVVVWLDSDTRNFGPHFVTDLVAPLLRDESILLCKGFYRRPVATVGSLGEGGGRVTELAARPLLGGLFPELAGVVQPLAGEYAGRAGALRSLPMFTGYGVEAGLLIDLVAEFGLNALAQTDLGTRVHRNRDISSLGRMAGTIIAAILTKAEELGRMKTPDGLSDLLVQFDQTEGGARPVITRIAVEQRPPMDEVRRRR